MSTHCLKLRNSIHNRDLWRFELKISTPVTPALGNIRPTPFFVSLRLLVSELRAQILDGRTNGRTDGRDRGRCGLLGRPHNNDVLCSIIFYAVSFCGMQQEFLVIHTWTDMPSLRLELLSLGYPPPSRPSPYIKSCGRPALQIAERESMMLRR